MHCQVSVELLGTDGAVALPLASRLYMPREWVADTERRRTSEVPENLTYLSKGALALTLIQDAMRDGMRPGIIQGDSTFGNDREFRVSLAQQNVHFFLEVDGSETMAWDFNSHSAIEHNDYQPRAVSLREIAKGFEASEWERCTYTAENGLVRQTCIGMREVFIDPGLFNLESRMEKLTLVADWPGEATDPICLYLTNLDRPQAAHCLKLARYNAYREHYRGLFEDKLDLGSYQGRSWKGFHHHLVLAIAAYLFVLILERRSKAAFWAEVANNIAVDPAVAAETHRLTGVLFRSKAGEPDFRSMVPGPFGTLTANRMQVARDR